MDTPKREYIDSYLSSINDCNKKVQREIEEGKLMTRVY